MEAVLLILSCKILDLCINSILRLTKFCNHIQLLVSISIKPIDHFLTLRAVNEANFNKSWSAKEILNSRTLLITNEFKTIFYPFLLFWLYGTLRHQNKLSCFNSCCTCHDIPKKNQVKSFSLVDNFFNANRSNRTVYEKPVTLNRATLAELHQNIWLADCKIHGSD